MGWTIVTSRKGSCKSSVDIYELIDRRTIALMMSVNNAVKLFLEFTRTSKHKIVPRLCHFSLLFRYVKTVCTCRKYVHIRDQNILWNFSVILDTKFSENPNLLWPRNDILLQRTLTLPSLTCRVQFRNNSFRGCRSSLRHSLRCDYETKQWVASLTVKLLVRLSDENDKWSRIK